MKNITVNYTTPKQGIFPSFFFECLDITDPVFTFDRFMEEINLNKYLKDIPRHTLRRLRYHPVNMLKTVLFGFMDEGYISLRKLEDNCKVNIRYKYLMDGQKPSYRTFGYFINKVIGGHIETLFNDITKQITTNDHVDLKHIYIDGSKFEASSNKYTWVWKKSTIKSRYRLYARITQLLNQINDQLMYSGVKIEPRSEYVPEYLEIVLHRLKEVWNLDEEKFVSGRGHRKSYEQRVYQQLKEYLNRLRDYGKKIAICGEGRNSYSKTDTSATFMRIKKDYMGNDQLLPAYNVQIGVADEYIVVLDVNQYRSDMDCFIPLMEKFHKIYGYYPEYPVADAGYGSFNNYLYCKEHGMNAHMKFAMFHKTLHDKKYRTNPFRAVNFETADDGSLVCPNGKHFRLCYKKDVKGNRYGRQEEVYECEDCSNCPYATLCKKSSRNRRINLNRELTEIHEEILNKLTTTHGLLLRRNRAVQAEGTFGIMKRDRRYKRIERRGIESVKLEVILVSIGHNLYKYHNKMNRKQADIA